MSAPLMVLVRDKDNRPVKDAPVLFSVRSGGGFLQDASTSPAKEVMTLSVLTDAEGIARAPFVPGQSVFSNPIAYTRDGDTYANTAGQNLMNAQLDSGSGAVLVSPIAILGFAAATRQACCPSAMAFTVTFWQVRG